MTGGLTRIWIALGLAASWILPAGAASRAPLATPSAAVAAPAGALARPEAPLRVEAGPARSGPQDLRPVHAPKLPSRHAPALHRGSPEDSPGTPPGGAPDDLAPAAVALPQDPTPAASPSWTHHPRTFSPQGLKPEQGGQTGPPRNAVSA